MTDAVLSQIEQVLQGIETRTEHTLRCRQNDVRLNMQGAPPDCICERAERLRAEIARTVERMGEAIAAEYQTSLGALIGGLNWRDGERLKADALAAGIRAAGGTPQ